MVSRSVLHPLRILITHVAVLVVTASWAFGQQPGGGDESFVVQAVVGTVRCGAKPLQKGDVVTAACALQFGAGGKLLVSSATHGRIVIQPGPTQTGTETGLSINDFLGSTRALGTRAGTVPMFDQLQTATDFTVFGPQMAVPFPARKYPLSGGAYFSVTFELPGDTALYERVLEVSGGSLLIDKERIYTAHGGAIEDPTVIESVSVYYVSPSEEPEEIARLRLQFVDDPTLHARGQEVIDLLGYSPATATEADYHDLKRSLMALAPWRVAQSNVEGWLAEAFGIQKPS